MSYRDDLDAAVNRASSLDRENAQLRKELNDAKAPKKQPKEWKEPKVDCPTCKGPFYRIGAAVFLSSLGVILGLGIFLLFYTMITEHGDGNCYVQGEGLVFKLKKTVHWGEDRTVGEYRSVPEALVDASRIGCKVE